MFVSFSSRREFTADGIMSMAYGTLGNKNLESSWKLRCKKQDITWLTASLITDPRGWHDKAKGGRATESNKLTRWINKLWAEVRSSNGHLWDGEWQWGRTHQNYKTLPSLLQYTRQFNTWILIRKPTGHSLPLFEMKRCSPGYDKAGPEPAVPTGCLHSASRAALGRGDAATPAPGRPSPPAHLPLQGLGPQQAGPDQSSGLSFHTRCPSCSWPGTSAAQRSRLEDGERRRAECLVKLQDHPADPTATKGQAAGCWLTGSGKRGRSAGEHTGNERRLRLGKPAPRRPRRQRGSLRRGAWSGGSLARLHGIPAVHSVPGLWFLYLENNRAGLDSAQGPSQCSRSRDPGIFESNLQRSTQNVLTSVHWNPCHLPAQVFVNIWSKHQHFFNFLKRSSQVCPNWRKSTYRQTDPDSLAEEAGVRVEAGPERQNCPSGSTFFPGQAQGHLRALGFAVLPNNATHRPWSPGSASAFFSTEV